MKNNSLVRYPYLEKNDPPARKLNIKKYSNRKNKSKCFTAYCFDWNFTLLVLSNLEAVSEAVILRMIQRAILRDCVRPSERSLWNVWWYFLELYCLPPRRRNRRRKILNKFYEISAFTVNLNQWVPKGAAVDVFHLIKIFNSLRKSFKKDSAVKLGQNYQEHSERIRNDRYLRSFFSNAEHLS